MSTYNAVDHGSVTLATTIPDDDADLMASDVNVPIETLFDNDAHLNARLTTVGGATPVLSKYQGAVAGGSQAGSGSFIDSGEYVDIAGCKVGDLIWFTWQFSGQSTSTSTFGMMAYEDHAGANVAVPVGPQLITPTMPAIPYREVNLVGSWIVAHAGVVRLMMQTKSAGGQTTSWGATLWAFSASTMLATRVQLGV